MRAAMVGGVAYHVGKKSAQGQEAEAEQNARLDEMESQQYQQQQQPQYAPPPPAAPAPNQGISPDAMEQLKQLADLKSQGILTDEEFDAQKKKILGL